MVFGRIPVLHDKAKLSVSKQIMECAIIIGKGGRGLKTRGGA